MGFFFRSHSYLIICQTSNSWNATFKHLQKLAICPPTFPNTERQLFHPLVPVSTGILLACQSHPGHSNSTSLPAIVWGWTVNHPSVPNVMRDTLQTPREDTATWQNGAKRQKGEERQRERCYGEGGEDEEICMQSVKVYIQRMCVFVGFVVGIFWESPGDRWIVWRYLCSEVAGGFGFCFLISYSMWDLI